MRAMPTRREPKSATARKGICSSRAGRRDSTFSPFTIGCSPTVAALSQTPGQTHAVQLGVDVGLETAQRLWYAPRKAVVVQRQAPEVAQVAQFRRDAPRELVALQGQHLEPLEPAQFGWYASGARSLSSRARPASAPFRPQDRCPTSGARVVQIPAGNRLKSYRTARSAFLAIGPDPTPAY